MKKNIEYVEKEMRFAQEASSELSRGVFVWYWLAVAAIKLLAEIANSIDAIWRSQE